MEITRGSDDEDEEYDYNHPIRHVLFQLSVDGNWSDVQMRTYLQNVWLDRKSTYTPNVPSIVTEAWIFNNHQSAVHKIASLQVNNNYKYNSRVVHDVLHFVSVLSSSPGVE